MTELYGASGAGKSTIATLLCASAQRQYPDMLVLYIDCEQAFNMDYAIENKDWGWYDWMLEDEPTFSDQLKEKRFHAACCAMNGIVSGLMQSEEWHGWTDKYIAERSYLLADELLKQGGFNE